MEKLNPVDQKRKKILMVNRIFGIAVSIAIFTLLLCFYFKSIDEWVFSICTIMLSAINFITCATVAKVAGRDNVNTANLFFSVIFFIIGLTFLIYGIATGNLLLPF